MSNDLLEWIRLAKVHAEEIERLAKVHGEEIERLRAELTKALAELLVGIDCVRVPADLTI